MPKSLLSCVISGCIDVYSYFSKIMLAGSQAVPASDTVQFGLAP